MRYIVGIDEVGRGSLAGPVAVAAVCIPRDLNVKVARLGELKDSKRLTPARREKWFEYFKAHPRVTYTCARAYPRTIERMNISRAANLAAKRAFERLVSVTGISSRNCQVFLDGGLYVGNGDDGRKFGAKTVVHGDKKIKVVAIASIVAKVSRDRYMTRLAKKYPRYGFEMHKGYGTKAHSRAIKKYGPSEVHRLTFLS
ncbi:MAG: ribonuclease HII [Patescibacteria group bacterium]